MKVKELIKKLNTLPGDYDIEICEAIYNCRTGYSTDYSADIDTIIVEEEDKLVTLYGEE